VIGESSKNIKGSKCLKCQNYGHVVARLFRNLLIREADNELIETLLVYEPTGSATDSDDDVRVSSVHWV